MTYEQAYKLKQSLLDEFIFIDRKVLRLSHYQKPGSPVNSLKTDIHEHVNGIAILKKNDNYFVKLYTEGEISVNAFLRYFDLRTQDIIIDNIGTISIQAKTCVAGCSIGHYQVSAGTLACFVKDDKKIVYGLSNSHVFANLNRGRINDPILQPGKKDGGKSPDDIIAELSNYVPVKFNGRNNFVDCAIAKLRDQDGWQNVISGIGMLKGVLPADLDLPVHKSGRTTQITSGTITSVDSTIKVDYGGGFLFKNIAIFDRQIEIKGLSNVFSRIGDSGSLIVHSHKDGLKAVGLLFAAGEDGTTFANPINEVFTALSVELL